jgi:hypothetical protein
MAPSSQGARCLTANLRHRRERRASASPTNPPLLGSLGPAPDRPDVENCPVFRQQPVSEGQKQRPTPHSGAPNLQILYPAVSCFSTTPRDTDQEALSCVFMMATSATMAIVLAGGPDGCDHWWNEGNRASCSCVPGGMRGRYNFDTGVLPLPISPKSPKDKGSSAN